MKLWEPGKIGKLLIRNRIIMAAMGIGAEPDGRLAPYMIDYYAARAQGGTGLIITGNMHVSREIDPRPAKGLFDQGFHLMIDDRMYINRLTQLAEAVHDHGAKFAVQLSAGGGRVTPLEFLRAAGAVAPSAVPCYYDPKTLAHPLSVEQIEGVVKAFEAATRIARTSGVDCVEINGHGGYLFDQFTCALWNKRTDKYGGNLEGRLRFAVETVGAIKRGGGADFPVIVKYGLTHYLEGAREVEEGLEIARRLEAAGADALDIDAGCYEAHYWSNPSEAQPPGCNVNLAEMVKKVVKIPVIVVGKLGDPKLAEKVLQEGKADFIGLGRGLLADPDWANKVKQGKEDDIAPCIGDYEGCLRRRFERKVVSCAVNPATGMEKEMAITPAAKKKSVLVVGGGPAGMEAARVAALRGHKMTLWEKNAVLGGNLIPASVPGFKFEYRRLIDYLSSQITKLGVDVNLSKEATPELIRAMKPEVVFIATGSTPIIPGIPGVKANKVITAVDLLLGKKKAGKSVVIIGGGMVGCETALHLAQQGKKLTVVEILGSLMADVHPVNREHLLKLLAADGVNTMLDTTVLEIADGGIAIADKNGRKTTLEADSVVLATGFKPNESLSEALKKDTSEVYAIGDCVQPRKVINAIWEGYRTARLV